MKKTKILSVAIFALLLCGCDKNSPEKAAGSGVPVEIATSLIAPFEVDEEDMGTKALGPLTGWNNSEVYMSFCQSAGAWTGWTEALKGLVTAAGSGLTLFQPLFFYPLAADPGGDVIHLRGFYPREGITNLGPGLEITGNKIEYTLTGREDLMLSNPVSGSLANTLAEQYKNHTGGELVYRHLLSQLSFRMIAEAGLPSTMKIVAIRVKNIRKNAVVDLDPAKDYTNALSFTDAPGAEFTLTYNNYVPSTTISVENGNVMIGPGENFQLEVEFSTGYKILVTNIKRVTDSVDISAGNTEAAKKYRIDLTFRTTPYGASATATWNVVATGIGGPGAGNDVWW